MGEVRLHEVIERGKPSQLNGGMKIHATGLVTEWPRTQRAAYLYRHLMPELDVQNKD